MHYLYLDQIINPSFSFLSCIFTEKTPKDKSSSHKAKKERKRKPEEKIATLEDISKTQTPPKKPCSASQPATAATSVEKSQEPVEKDEKSSVATPKEEKILKEETRAHRTRVRTPEVKDTDSGKESKREKRAEKEKEKQTHKGEKEKSKHHHKHKSRRHNDEKPADGQSVESSTGEGAVEKSSKHKSKHKHHHKSKHKKDEPPVSTPSVAPPPSSQPPAESTPSSTSIPVSSLVAAAATIVTTSSPSPVSEIVTKVDSTSDNSGNVVPTTTIATSVATSEPARVPPVNTFATGPGFFTPPTTSSAGDGKVPTTTTTSLSASKVSPTNIGNIPIAPSRSTFSPQRSPFERPTVASIVRSTAETIERVIVNELKRDSRQDNNGKSRSSEDAYPRRQVPNPFSIVDNNRRYPVTSQANTSSQGNNIRSNTQTQGSHPTQGIPTTQGITHAPPPVPVTSAGHHPYTSQSNYIASSYSSTSHQQSAPSTSNCVTTTTTTPSSNSAPSSAFSHRQGGLPDPTQNAIQVISRTTNAINPVVPAGSKPPVVTVSGVVKSEDIKRTLPVTAEGVEGHKPKEREKLVDVGRADIPPHLRSLEGKLPEHHIVQDSTGDHKGINNKPVQRDQDYKERRDSDGRPIASALHEPIQVYRDPNLKDTEVIHVNSVQHQLAYTQQVAASGGGGVDRGAVPPTKHSPLTSQRSTPTLHPPTSSHLGGAAGAPGAIGPSGPSAFVPSAQAQAQQAAALGGHIPSQHHLAAVAAARHPMFSAHVPAAALYQHQLAQAGHAAAAYGTPPHLVLNQHELHARHLAGLMHQESLARMQHHPQMYAQLHNAATAAAALQGMQPGLSAAQIQQLWQQQQVAGMPVPPTWILQQHHEELERLHHHQQQQQQQQQAAASEKSPSIPSHTPSPGGHHEKPRTPHTPQPAAASHPPPQRELPNATAASRESSVRHYAEFPPSDAQAAVQRHFQESLRKLHLPYTFSTSPGGGAASGSITAGTAIPKNEPGQPGQPGKDQAQVSYIVP